MPLPSAATVPSVRARVVVADDSDGIREVIGQMLRAEYDIVEFNNGASAWKYIEADNSVAALISDIDMPELDGIELIRHIRHCPTPHIRQLPVIAITGNTDQDTRRRAFVCGATCMMTKPVDRKQLLDLAHAYIRHVPATASSSAGAAMIGVNPEPVVPLESPIDVAAIAPSVPTPVVVTIPAELLSLDAALHALQHGNEALLMPYITQLEQRMAPLLEYYRQREGEDLR